MPKSYCDQRATKKLKSSSNSCFMYSLIILENNDDLVNYIHYNSKAIIFSLTNKDELGGRRFHNERKQLTEMHGP